MDVFSGICLSVCLFVCQHDNWRTIRPKRRMMKRDGYDHSTKISPEFERQGQRSRSPGTKNQKVRHFVRESSSGAWSSCGILSGAVLEGASTPVGKSAHAI